MLNKKTRILKIGKWWTVTVKYIIPIVLIIIWIGGSLWTYRLCNNWTFNHDPFSDNIISDCIINFHQIVCKNRQLAECGWKDNRVSWLVISKYHTLKKKNNWDAFASPKLKFNFNFLDFNTTAYRISVISFITIFTVTPFTPFPLAIHVEIGSGHIRILVNSLAVFI